MRIGLNCALSLHVSTHNSLLFAVFQPVEFVQLHSSTHPVSSPPGGPNSFNFKISSSFWKNLAKTYVGVPPRVGAPTSGKSWIRH